VYASQEGHLDVVRELLKAGADPTLAAGVGTGTTALGADTRIVQLLQEHGATA